MARAQRTGQLIHKENGRRPVESTARVASRAAPAGHMHSVLPWPAPFLSISTAFLQSVVQASALFWLPVQQVPPSPYEGLRVIELPAVTASVQARYFLHSGVWPKVPHPATANATTTRNF